MASATAPPRARLHVSGLPRELLDDELRARFAPFGAVRAVEVLREKRDSPFRRWHDDLGGDDADPLRGLRVGRVGRVGRGGGLAAVVAVAPRRPPPCRGFAYVELAPKDAKSLARCVTLYNGCKWKGGVMRVERAKPRWDERLREELEERDGGEKRPRRAGGRDADGPGPSASETPPPPPPLPSLARGDELVIDGRARDAKVTVAYGVGAKTHRREFDPEPTRGAAAADWTPFPEDATWRTARRLCQLPNARLRIPKPAARGRREVDGLEMLRDASGDASSDSHGAGPSSAEDADAAEDGASTESRRRDRARDAEQKAADRFALPREFFSSAAARERANARREGDASGAPARTRNPRTFPDTVEGRALAAFLGSDGLDDSEEDGASEDEGEPESPRAPRRNPPPPPRAEAKAKAKAKTRETTAAPEEPGEGGSPLGATDGANGRRTRWWEEADEKGGGRAGSLLASAAEARDARRAATSRDAPIAADFFRSSAPATFRRSKPPAVGSDGPEVSSSDASSGGAAEISEDELLGDWEGEEDEDEDEDEEEGEDEEDEDEDEEEEEGEDEDADASDAEEDDDASSSSDARESLGASFDGSL